MLHILKTKIIAKNQGYFNSVAIIIFARFSVKKERFKSICCGVFRTIYIAKKKERILALGSFRVKKIIYKQYSKG
uniref:Uncharacterized protein n=1 Tax=viral metagenome TaxID=1070528 RepID=A0A6C0ECB8_9ZZZZ